MHQKMVRALAVVLGWFTSAVMAASPPKPLTTQLANGMEVIVLPDHRAPSVVHMIWYDVGNVDEPAGKTGVAHLFEHMMFKGTPSVPADAFSQKIAELGGRDNAFTSRDFTAYFQQIPPKGLATVMALEADRMQHLTFDPEAFAKERDVVIEERKLRTDDVPEALGFETLMALLFFAHPYRNPVIGWPTDLAQLTLEDVRHWYQKWYAPNNARLVVVGDVDPQEVVALANQYYGAIAPRPVPAAATRTRYDEPPKSGIRQAVVMGKTELPTVLLGWRVPALRDPDKDRDVAALVALAAVLDGFDGARLPQQLTKKKALAVSVGAGADVQGRGPGLFTVSAKAAPGISPDQVVAEINRIISQIAQDGITQAELKRVVRQYAAQQVYQRDSLMGQAMRIGMARAVGLPLDTDERLLALMETLTPEEVRAATRWLDPNQLVRVDVLPQAYGKPGEKP